MTSNQIAKNQQHLIKILLNRGLISEVVAIGEVITVEEEAEEVAEDMRIEVVLDITAQEAVDEEPEELDELERNGFPKVKLRNSSNRVMSRNRKKKIKEQVIRIIANNNIEDNKGTFIKSNIMREVMEVETVVETEAETEEEIISLSTKRKERNTIIGQDRTLPHNLRTTGDIIMKRGSIQLI